MNFFINKDDMCKTPGCNRESYIDGYCKKCFDKNIQFETLKVLKYNISVLSEINKNVIQLGKKFEQIQEKIMISDSSLKDNNIKQEEKIKKNINKKETKTEIFIPSFISDVKNDEINIISNKNEEIDKNITDVVDKLSKL